MFIRRLAEGCIVPVTRVRGGTTNDETRLEDACLSGKTLVVNELGLRVKSIGEGLEVDRGGSNLLLGSLDGKTVGKYNLDVIARDVHSNRV